MGHGCLGGHPPHTQVVHGWLPHYTSPFVLRPLLFIRRRFPAVDLPRTSFVLDTSIAIAKICQGCYQNVTNILPKCYQSVTMLASKSLSIVSRCLGEAAKLTETLKEFVDVAAPIDPELHAVTTKPNQTAPLQSSTFWHRYLTASL